MNGISLKALAAERAPVGRICRAVPLSVSPVFLAVFSAAAAYLFPRLASAGNEAVPGAFSLVLPAMAAALLLSAGFRAVFARSAAEAFARGEPFHIRGAYRAAMGALLPLALLLSGLFLYMALSYAEMEPLSAGGGALLFLCAAAAMTGIPALSAEAERKSGWLLFPGAALLSGLTAAALLLTDTLDASRAALAAVLAGWGFLALAETVLIARRFPAAPGGGTEGRRFLLRHKRLFLSALLLTLGALTPLFAFWYLPGGETVSLILPARSGFDEAVVLAACTGMFALPIWRGLCRGRPADAGRACALALQRGTADGIRLSGNALFSALRGALTRVFLLQLLPSAALTAAALYLLPGAGLAAAACTLYPSLAAGYAIFFLLCCAWNLLSCLGDDTGMFWTALVFCAVAAAGTLAAAWFLPESLSGAGLILGALCSFTAAYLRLHLCETRCPDPAFLS